MLQVKKYGYNVYPALWLALAVLLAPGCSSGDPASHSWLHGSWELTFNPQKDDADVITFNSDGTVSIATADGHGVIGKYAVLDQEVALTLVSNQKIVDVRFAMSPDHTRLVYENGAYYTKKP